MIIILQLCHFQHGYEHLCSGRRRRVNYYNVASGAQSATRIPVSLVTLQSGFQWRGFRGTTALTATMLPTADSNGFYWGEPERGRKVGFNPDGSQAVFGLSAT